jgi:hypothetical protein
MNNGLQDDSLALILEAAHLSQREIKSVVLKQNSVKDNSCAWLVKIAAAN